MLSLTPQAFVTKWKAADQKERSASQEHFIDICRLIGHPTPVEADPEGHSFAFEAGATKARGGQGWADVWKKNFFAWEYKGKHADLDKAYQQLLQYHESLMSPPLLVVCDLDTIVIHTKFTNTVKRTVRIDLDDLLDPACLAQLRAVFYEPEAFRAPQTTEQVTQEIAAEFAHLSELLRQYGADPREAAHFLIRLLFCLFAEDIGLLPKNLFSRLVQGARRNPAAFNAQLGQLFQAMATGGWFGVDEIAHFNGKLFDNAQVLPLDSASLNILARVCTLDWSNIEPSIFGTLFERSLDPGKRSQLGAHYTGKEDILLIVEPVLMAPLRHRWDEVQQQARDLAHRRDEATGRARNNRQNELTALLTGFAAEIARVRVLDAACGSGNFLYIALKQLLDLEKTAIALAGDLGVGRFFPSVSPTQLYGIEIDDYAHELAQATIWIGYIQWLHDNGFGTPGEPILKPLENIARMDAILTYDEDGKPVEPEWPQADVIIGNPPFLGDKKMRAELGDEYVQDLRSVYSDRIPGQSDLVCYWFEKARSMIERNIVRRVGLLATQGIRGGANRTVLTRIKEIGDIFWAQSDRNWILDGAIVHVSMIGFDNGTDKTRMLDDQFVKKINADLSSAVDLTQAQSLAENSGLAFIGTQKGGAFDIQDNVAQQMLEAKGNPNGRPNLDVVRPWVNGSDLAQRNRGMWIIDFGADMSKEDASQYEAPFEYVRKRAKPSREKSRSESRTTEQWWLHQRPRPEMREAFSHLSRYIATPRVSKYRIFVWQDVVVLPDSAVVVIARQDDYFLGVLHSKWHELWARSTGTQLREAESGFRYSQTMTFETFPFPWPPGTENQDDPLVQAIAGAARELVEKRDRWLNPEGASEAELKKRTLTNLYNQRPTWLDLAHKKLDAAVLDAYGWPHDLADGDIRDEEILERLLALNLERSGAG